MSVSTRKRGDSIQVIEKRKDPATGKWKQYSFTLTPYETPKAALGYRRDMAQELSAEIPYAQMRAHRIEALVRLVWEGPLERYHNGKVPRLEEVQTRVLGQIEEAEKLRWVHDQKRAAKEIVGVQGYYKNEPEGYTADFTVSCVLGTYGMDDFIYALRELEEWQAEARELREAVKKHEDEARVLEDLVSKNEKGQHVS